MRNNLRLFIFLLVVASINAGCSESYRHPEYAGILDDIRKPVIEKAERYLDEEPETVTWAYCGRSAGGRHDFYSEGDYWWPDPDNPGGPYIRRDGLSNPEVFSEHRHVMVRLSEITATAGFMARLTENREIINLCVDRFKNIVLPDQMGSDGSFPRELDRTKPYGYALFNIDAFANVAQILSTPEDNLWEFETPDGRSLKLGMEFIFPYIEDKSSWPHGKDVYIWEEWPLRQSSLLFAGLAYNRPEYIEKYLALPAEPDHPEVIRNLPVRHPAIWIE